MKTKKYVEDLRAKSAAELAVLPYFFDPGRIVQLICCVLESQIEKFFFSSY